MDGLSSSKKSFGCCDVLVLTEQQCFPRGDCRAINNYITHYLDADFMQLIHSELLCEPLHPANNSLQFVLSGGDG